jgi:hypothetical protein
MGMKRILSLAVMSCFTVLTGCADHSAGVNAASAPGVSEAQPRGSSEAESAISAAEAKATDSDPAASTHPEETPAEQFGSAGIPAPTAESASQASSVADTSSADTSAADTSAEKNGSTESAETRPQRVAQTRSSTPERISFDDLNCGMQADIVFRDWMLTDRVKELDGQVVRVAGYMHPDVKQKGITEFILLRNTECKFGPSGQADHLIRVKLDPGVTTSFSSKPVEVLGKLTVNPFMGPDGKTWSIFDMTGKSVEPYRR